MFLLSLALNLLVVSGQGAVTQSDVQHSGAQTAQITPGFEGFNGRTWGEVANQYRADVNQALRASSDPRDWLLESYAMLDKEGRGEIGSADPTDEKASGALLRKAAEAAPEDRLVQWVWARANPKRSGCDNQRPCSDRAMALARLEPGNAAAWEPVVSAALRACDIQKAEAGLAQMAAATDYNDRIEEAALSFRQIYQRFPLASAPLSWAMNQHETLEIPLTAESLQDFYSMVAAEDLTQEIWDETTFPGVLCSRAGHSEAHATRFRDCAQIGRLLIDHGNPNGRFYLNDSGRDTDSDRIAARLLDWRTWEEDDFSHEPLVFEQRIRDWFADIEETHDGAEASNRALSRRNIPLSPPADWNPPGGVYSKWRVDRHSCTQSNDPSTPIPKLSL